jgi:uncharacterized membrane protein
MGMSSGSSPKNKHPFHPIFTHFPMALLAVSSLWDLLGIWRGDPFWWMFAFWSIAIGLIMAFLALVTGLIDYVKIPQGGPAENAAMRHMIIMVLALLIYAGSLLLRFYSSAEAGGLLFTAMALSLAGLAVLLLGGWYGGELVYRHGVGRIEAQVDPNNDPEK